MRRFLNFLTAEDGAVTIDWVVITAVICGLGVGVATTIAEVTTNESNSIGAWLEDMDVPEY